MAKFTIRCGLIILQYFLLISTAHAQNSYYNCITPYGVNGFCKSLLQCPLLLNILQSPARLTPEAVNYLRNSVCRSNVYNKVPIVCCPLEQRTFNNNNHLSVHNNPLLPSDCGRDLSLKIVGGEIADFDEFPWIVLLEYRKPPAVELGTDCGGALVSKRYVVTAAHCVVGLPGKWVLTSVRLGEYDTSMDLDCIEDGYDSEICTDDPRSIGIAEKIVHEGYNTNNQDQTNDIALLRLMEDVTFTNFIQPICLPDNERIQNNLWVAGWGMTENRIKSNIKRKVKIRVSDQYTCSEKYKTANINLVDSQLCVGGEKGIDTCRGDSGGPLMSLENMPDNTGKWTLVGVVSFGPTPCGMKKWPGVYTRVDRYVSWILSKLR